MDERQQRQINEAAEKFAEAIKESYQAIAGRSVSAQELNARLTQDFFNSVINNLRTEAESNRALAEDLIEQQRKQQEAAQQLPGSPPTPTWTSSTLCSPTLGRARRRLCVPRRMRSLPRRKPCRATCRGRPRQTPRSPRRWRVSRPTPRSRQAKIKC